MKASISVISMLCAILIGIMFVIPVSTEASMDVPDCGYEVEAEGIEVTVQAYQDRNGNDCLAILDRSMIEPYFETESVECYAYLDLYAAEEKLIPVILEARNRIIFAEGWVADEIDGWVSDEEGNVIEVLSHFHEIFPEEWEIPCFPTEYNAQPWSAP